MSHQLSSEDDFLFYALQIEIKQLLSKIQSVKTETFEFENFLRNELESEIIEEQELSILYKNLQKAKKEKRLAQKKKGKNYKEPISVPVVSKITDEEKVVLKDKKKLYREAMLFVHPDRFSNNEQDENLATEITTELIRVYKQGTLQELQQIHQQITSQKNLSSIQISQEKQLDTLELLQQKKNELEKELVQLQKRHTYIVLTTYANPKDYLQEVKAYYKDRLFKLRKRTRKVTSLK
ncbi:hypothetical protein AXE80_04175 [Wenyingzhuangia fucanilytica]|uniref:J domain-containing protein n=1 Tax=Wenyingzhuangia fucanilytica TaxID=1790137 RepID=A0A1B1Y433_9FLAO|nr:hypothetical protein [Wenyingzhuangia fucanilytica]ANW95526.1 hypothetical protein AXE80_04175 [Wenyingzhuangia fucanilytica]